MSPPAGAPLMGRKSKLTADVTAVASDSSGLDLRQIWNLPDSPRGARARWCRLVRGILIIGLTVFLFPGCGTWKADREKRRVAARKKATPPPKAPQLVGRIVLVSLEGNFVLIDNESRPSPAMGTALRTGKEEIAPAEIVELKVTEIRKRPFVIADIVRGQPQKGDLVFE